MTTFVKRAFLKSVTSYEKRLAAAKRASTSHLLMRCARLVNERALASLPTPEGVDRPRAAHLALFPHIELEGGTRITTLASKLGITKQAVGQLVDDLERMGVVERVTDPNDKRAKRVVFTEAGRTSMLEGLAHLRGIDRDLGRAMGGETMGALHEALERLHDHLAPEQEA